MNGAARRGAIAGAVAGLAALVLQFVILLQTMQIGPLGVVWRFVSYFTILTNIFVTAIFVAAALGGGATRWLNSARIEAMGTTAIIFVSVVYHTMLQQLWDPQGAQLAADILLHTTVPVLMAMYWVLRPHGKLNWIDAAFCVIWPFSYCIYGLARGALDGFYPYPFMDASKLAAPVLALNVAGLSAAFALGALALVGLDKALAKRL